MVSASANRDVALRAMGSRFEVGRRVAELLDAFLAHQRYDGAWAARLITTARGAFGDLWATRRLAALMLQHHVLRAAPDDLAAHDLLLRRLGLKRRRGATAHLRAFVLREGYTSREPRDFVRELRRRLARPRTLFAALNGKASSRAALLDFVAYSSHDCRLALARYLFTPAEVVARVLRHLRVSSGRGEIAFGLHAPDDEHLRTLLRQVPPYEGEILRRLAADARVYWVAERTSERIDALVSRPPGTVVLVVRPPGSEVEIEIKRCGRRGPQPISVVFERDGERVSPSHRFDGLSTLTNLVWDAGSAGRFRHFSRRVHNAAVAVPGTVALTFVTTVPTPTGESELVDYFSRKDRFGAGFGAMRRAMTRSIAAFHEENRHWQPPQDDGSARGLTKRFFHDSPPGQAILCGTSALRLDRLAAYLEPDGPRRYFEDELGVAHDIEDARRFNDMLLEEILGVYQPPASGIDPAHRMAAAFAANRERADRCFLALAKQIGRTWGSLLGLVGYSHGESFVARNVGLRSVWAQGRWRVEIVFMDHDNLQLCAEGRGRLHGKVFRGMANDEKQIYGDTDHNPLRLGELDYLRQIYRASPPLVRRARAVIDAATERTFLVTRRALYDDPELRREAPQELLALLPSWGRATRRLLVGGGRRAGDKKRREAARAALVADGYDPDYATKLIDLTAAKATFFLRRPFLYRAANGGVTK